MPITEQTKDLVNGLIPGLTEAVMHVFSTLIADVAPEDVLGFALLSDPDGASLVAAAYTRGDHEANLAKYATPEYQDDPDFDWDLFLRWAPQEWQRRSDGTGTEMERVWDRIQATKSRVVGEDPAYWPTGPWMCAVIAISNLFHDGWCAQFPNAVQIFEVTDEEFDEDQLLEWAVWMNSEQQVQQYRRWLAQEGD